MYKSRLKKDPSTAEKAPIIWITPGYHDYNFTAHPRLDVTRTHFKAE